jgi:hypothetical protein
MLREIVPTRQISDEPYRKWFADRAFDLIVWFSPSNDVVGFQLCYLKGENEHALTWWKDRGFSHARIDDGEGRPDSQKMTPILVADGTMNKKDLIAMFREKSEAIDPDLVRFITEKIEKYPQIDG